jgi:hypothetical protein
LAGATPAKSGKKTERIKARKFGTKGNAGQLKNRQIKNNFYLN